MPFGARPLGRVMTPSSVQALAFGAAFAFDVAVVVFFVFAAAEAAALGCLAAAALGFFFELLASAAASIQAPEP